ncbi:MAG: cyclic nucleotide-binding domain-containing protein, partial [Cyanobacteria bacterium K_Offshore_surface_m2_239]|nr:cyclic nucleotide-binding domain-containing protein [Cyanobacteria bacterium K_Offshore_surface_m2_239]
MGGRGSATSDPEPRDNGHTLNTMVSTSPSTDQRRSWLSLAPFTLLSPEASRRLEQESELQRFAEGQVLSSASAIGARILVVLEGEARLLGLRESRPFTLRKLGTGDIVGLASLLRAAPCEQVSAATPVVAMALPDALVLELLRQEAPFQEWCAGHLWLAELHGLLVGLEDRNATAEPFDPARWRQRLERLAERARMIQPRRGAVAAAGETLYLASGNVPDLPLGSPLKAGAPLPTPLPPLPLRLIALPEEGAGGVEASLEPSSALVAGTVGEEASLPPPTSLDLGQAGPQRGFALLRAKGDVAETTACLQMLAKGLNLPFRRDAVEKMLREKVAQGQRPNLQLCAQIASMMGLLVSGARVRGEALNRLITPALVPWKEGFAILVRSHGGGWTLASPRDGWVRLSPAEVQAAYPEGLELMLVERSITTPEER